MRSFRAGRRGAAHSEHAVRLAPAITLRLWVQQVETVCKQLGSCSDVSCYDLCLCDECVPTGCDVGTLTFISACAKMARASAGPGWGELFYELRTSGGAGLVRQALCVTLELSREPRRSHDRAAVCVFGPLRRAWRSLCLLMRWKGWGCFFKLRIFFPPPLPDPEKHLESNL